MWDFRKKEIREKISEIINLVIPATRITARMSVVSSELSVRTRAAISQTTGSKLKKKRKKQNIIELLKDISNYNSLA